MSATEIEDTGVPLPRISEIRALPDLRLSIVWAEGSRTGRADTVDLAPLINTYKLYRPLRSNEELFQTAHLVDDGNVVAWGDGKVDMAAELIEEIAKEAMTPQDFASFLRRNDLTQEAAAALLGYSPRQIGNFASTGPIPRLVALACYGYEARSGADKKRQPLPEALPDIYEQAAKEARAMLSQAAQHFADQLRGISSDMRSEVKATRAELRKSILELPQETAESAAQMRRAIEDQIEALREIEAARAELRKSILELPQETAESADQIRRVIEDQIEALGEIEATRAELRRTFLNRRRKAPPRCAV